MSKRLRPRTRRVASGTPVPEVTGTALLVVDQAPFLNKALSNCKRLRKELHKKQALLADFEEADRGAFQQWLNSTHGATLTEIRDYRDEFAAYRFILHHLSECANVAFEDVPDLYVELFKRKKDGTLYSYESPRQPEPEPVDEEEDDDAWEGVFGEDDDDEADAAFRKFCDSMFEGDDSEEDPDSDALQSERAAQVANDARLKTCYRNLAKRLHPDHSTLEETIRAKRWHEIQDAYHQKDLEGLLRVEAICDMDDEGLSLKLGLARLRDLAAYHKSHLIPIRGALRAAKQDIAFGFSKNGPSPQIEREIAGDLKYELIELKGMMAHLKRAAKEIRNEVEAQLHQDAIRAARRARHNEPLIKPRSSKQRAAESDDTEQMHFF